LDGFVLTAIRERFANQEEFKVLLPNLLPPVTTSDSATLSSTSINRVLSWSDTTPFSAVQGS
jgi:hypothetical protein